MAGCPRPTRGGPGGHGGRVDAFGIGCGRETIICAIYALHNGSGNGLAACRVAYNPTQISSGERPPYGFVSADATVAIIIVRPWRAQIARAKLHKMLDLVHRKITVAILQIRGDN